MHFESYHGCIFGLEIREIPRTQCLGLSDPAILNKIPPRPAILFSQVARPSEESRVDMGNNARRVWILENSNEVSSEDRRADTC